MGLHGRPPVSEVAMKGPLDIHQHLLAHDVHHEIVRLRRTAFHASSLTEALGIPGRLCVTAHAYHAATVDADLLVVVLAPADTPIDDAEMCHNLSDALRDRLGGPAFFERAGCDLVSSRTDYIASHLCPLLLPPEVIVVAHQSLADLTTAIVYTATGDAGTALGLRALDLLVLTKATVLPTRTSRRRRRPVTIDLAQTPTAVDFEEAGRRGNRGAMASAATPPSARSPMTGPQPAAAQTARAAS